MPRILFIQLVFLCFSFVMLYHIQHLIRLDKKSVMKPENSTPFKTFERLPREGDKP